MKLARPRVPPSPAPTRLPAPLPAVLQPAVVLPAVAATLLWAGAAPAQEAGEVAGKDAVEETAVETVEDAGAGAGADLPDLYRRTPMVGGDPFARLTVGRPSLGLGARAAGGNSALDLNDLGAILFLAERDSLRAGDALDALGLVPAGEGLTGYGDAGSGLTLGLPVTRRLTVGAGLGGRGYGSFRVDDDAVALLRDGNNARSEFRLGETRADGLLTGEAGLHAVLRPAGAGPWGSTVAVGAGIRYVQPLYYARAASLLEGESEVVVAPDSVRARVSVAADRTPSVGGRGGGLLADATARLAWPGRGVAVEAAVHDLGRVSVDGLVRRSEEVDLATTRLDSVVDAVESLSFPVRDTLDGTVTPPARLSLTASLWSRLPVQLDGRLLVPVGGDFDRPPPIGELVSTWRHGNLPVRAGLRVGGRSGLGARLGLGWEGRRFYVRGSAVSGGGLGGGARGLGARLGAGVWF